jgi:hypothetical protein
VESCEAFSAISEAIVLSVSVFPVPPHQFIIVTRSTFERE